MLEERDRELADGYRCNQEIVERSANAHVGDVKKALLQSRDSRKTPGEGAPRRWGR